MSETGRKVGDALIVFWFVVLVSFPFALLAWALWDRLA